MDDHKWVYYRIFLRDPAAFDQFVTLLNQVVSPVVEQMASDIAHFHYFFYSGMYNQHSSDTGVVDRLSDVKDDDIIAFIRFRILAQTLDARKRIDELVRERIDQCDAVRGYEVPNSPFGIEENFITRFGNTRLQQVFDLIEAASRLGLSFAGSEEPINPNGDGGPQGLVHLVANPLRYLHAGYASVVQIWGKGGFTQSTLL